MVAEFNESNKINVKTTYQFNAQLVDLVYNVEGDNSILNGATYLDDGELRVLEKTDNHTITLTCANAEMLTKANLSFKVFYNGIQTEISNMEISPVGEPIIDNGKKFHWQCV